MKYEKIWLRVTKKQTLDTSDWDEMENIGQKMLDEMMLYLKNISSKPVWDNPAEKAIEKNRNSHYCSN